MCELITVNDHLISLKLRGSVRQYLVQDFVFYKNGQMEVPKNDLIKAQMLKIRYERNLAGREFKPLCR